MKTKENENLFTYSKCSGSIESNSTDGDDRASKRHIWGTSAAGSPGTNAPLPPNSYVSAF